MHKLLAGGVDQSCGCSEQLAYVHYSYKVFIFGEQEYTYFTRILYAARPIAICIDMAECKCKWVVVAVQLLEQQSSSSLLLLS